MRSVAPVEIRSFPGQAFDPSVPHHLASKDKSFRTLQSCAPAITLIGLQMGQEERLHAWR